MDDQVDEQLDFGEDEELLEGDQEDEQLLDEADEDEAGYDDGNGAHNEAEAEEDELAGLGDEDMQDVQEPRPNGDSQQGQQQQEGQQDEQDKQGPQQDGHGKKVIDLTKSSNRLAMVQPTRSSQQQPRQPAQQQQQQVRAPAQQVKGPVIPRPGPRETLRTPLRYFMVRSVNADNWKLAQREACWATQPRNEGVFGTAYQNGHEVVLFMSVQKSGAIQGYGRMVALPGSAPQVPWLDIDADVVNNFYVSWDCTTPISFNSIKHLLNPWCDHRQGAFSKGPPLPLPLHRDGQELAPQIGEQLLQAMNRNAASAGKPASGPLVKRFPAAGAAPAAGQGFQHRPGMLPQQQMHMQQPQPRMMMMQQQQRGMGGRGIMGGPPGPMGGGPPGPMGPGRGMPGRMMQQQPLPPPGRPQGPAGGPGGMMDPRLNPRFAGRLNMDAVDDYHPGARSGVPIGVRDGWNRAQQGDRHYDGRDRRYERDRDHERGDEDRHGRSSKSRRHSRSRSRSPPRAANSRGGSTGRAAVGESSWGSPEQQRRQQDDEPESIQDMSYEQYLATWEKVQKRIATLQQASSTVQQQPPPQQQQQLQLALPGPPQQPQPLQQQQQMAGGASMMGARGPAAGATGITGGGAGGVAGGGRVMGGPNGVMRQGAAAAAAGVDGAQGPGRPSDAPPTLAEYMQRIKSNLAARGQPIPSDDFLRAKYQEKLMRAKQAQAPQQQQQQQQQPQQRMQQQPQPSMGGVAGPGMGVGMGMGMNNAGMNPMNAAAMNPMIAMNMNPMGMMAATAMAAAAATNMMGMMGAPGMGGGMMGGRGGAGGMMGPGPLGGGMGGMQMQQGMGQMGRGGGRQGAAGRGGRGQMPMQQMGGGY